MKRTVSQGLYNICYCSRCCSSSSDKQNFI